MSKVTKRKITVENPGNKLSNSNTISNIISNKDSQRRQSVFERLGTKTGASISINTGIGGPQQSSGESFCRHWSQNGTCPYGKSCVFVNTHILISPSKRVQKKDLDPKQVLARSLEEGLKLEGLKRLHSTVIKRGSPDLNWESWDQTDLEYEDEKVLEKRRQLLQRELELQMRREETEEHHRHPNTKQKKGISSSSSTSLSSTTSESSTSSDDSSSDSTSTSGVGGDFKRRRNKTKKTKRGSTSSVSDSGRNKVRSSNKSMHKDRSPSNMSRKSAGSRDKRAFTPPKKAAPSAKMVARKKSLSPHRRHNTPTASSKGKPSTSKTASTGGSRHNQSPRPSKRSTSVDRKDKHKRSLSPRPRGKPGGTKERSPRRPDTRPPRRKDSPDSRARNTSRPRQPDRSDDRKKDDDRSRNKDDRRLDRKPASDRDKRDHDDARAREKAREAAREKEREEALERCRERQREREQQAKEKERNRDRPRDDRDKDNNKQRDYDKSVPPIMTVSVHNQGDRKLTDRDRDRSNKDRKDREKDRDKDKERDRDRLYDRNVDKSDRNRPLEKDRLTEKLPDRGNEKDRPRERENLNDRSRDRADRDRSFDRDRNFERNAGEPADRSFDRDKERASKVIDRNRDRDFERDKDRNYDRITDNRRSFEKAGERDKASLEKDRGIVRDRAIDRVLELRERNKSLERGRVSDGERSVDRNRERFDREGRFDRRALAGEDKGYESPYDSRRDRSRYGAEGAERVSMFKEHSPPREDGRNLRHSQGFNEDRRSRAGRDVRGGWEQRGGYDDAGPAKARDWDYPDSRREWDTRNRHGDWEGAVEGEEWGRYGGGGEWGGDWRDEWQHRPPRHPQREDQTIVSSNHIIVRDANNDEAGGRRSQVLDSVEKDAVMSGDFKKEGVDSGAAVDSGSLKRPREESELVTEAKKPRLEEPPPSAMLEEALSDISDDPDEILNREDIDVTPQDSAMEEDARSLSTAAQPSAQELDPRLLEDRPSEEENIDNLDFEEISDEELEEEARANKGLGDALGVDWASLVAESRPRPAEAEPGAARRRWQPDSILARIGVSLQYAGEQLYDQIQQRLTDKKGEEGEEEKPGLLHPVASLHVALRDRQARRRCLFSGLDSFKRALSARTDIAIRRQLCNLPVATLESQQSSGFCQWVV